MHLRPAILALAALGLAASDARAQLPGLPRPHAEWRTVSTRHFVVHYPSEMAEWTLPMVERLESVHAAVSSMVGSQPKHRVTVIVEDPLNVSNGSANPGPLIYLWPTPPEPRSGIGDNRGWSELLAVHEYAHIAHLMRPTRNPRQRILWRLLPVPLDPILFKVPRWAIEGYATYIEGRLTGSGRPHGAWRPALLRQWAIEGRLPTYGQLSRTGGFYGGAMAYLAGSAFLEWLVEQKGEESLPNVWRRVTARQNRGFAEAFAGVFGGPPDELYGRFVAEMTRKALTVEDTLEAAGLVRGELVQRRDWFTGDPAISPDGSRIAIVLRSETQPPRLVVWKTATDTITDKEREARAKAQRLDPEDVPGIEWRPRPKKPVATLWPAGGSGHDHPRWMPDGKRILVMRYVGIGDGRYRPDLFLWNHQTGAVRRVTHGAAVRYADPSPDGRSAAGVRCIDGSCDVVRVDLESGAVSVMAEGSPRRAFYRPRWSPDGRQLVVAVQENGPWRLALLDTAGGAYRVIGPDDGAARFDAAWMPDGRTLVAVSTLGGIHNLELLPVDGGAPRPLTRVTGAALAPEPNPADSSVYYLALRSKGLDLWRIDPDSASLTSVVAIDPRLAPAAQVPPVTADTFAVAPIGTPRSYGLGPRNHFWFPTISLATEGKAGGLAIAGSDPVGRLGWVAHGFYGERSTWRGGSLAAAWRRTRPSLHAEAFWTRQRPSEQHDATPLAAVFDATLAGGTVWTALTRDFLSVVHGGTLGGSYASLDPELAGSMSRALAFGAYDVALRQTRGESWFSQSLGVLGTVGRTGGGSVPERDWTRLVATLSLGAGDLDGGIVGDVTYGTLRGDLVPYELFHFGGVEAPLANRAVLAQRIAMPALPVATLLGDELLRYRITLTSRDGLQPYYMAVSADNGFDDWYRVIGSDASGEIPPIPFWRLPGMRVTAGVAYPLDEPLKKRYRGYFSLSFVP